MGGDVFVLDMGDPVKIDDLARKMVHLSGYVVSESDIDIDKNTIDIKYTGLRSGEKLYEELLIGDNVKSTEHPKIMVAHEPSYTWDAMQIILEQFEEGLNDSNSKVIRELLEEYVVGFKPK